MGWQNDRRATEARNFFEYEVELASTANTEYRARWDDLVIPAASVNPTGIAGAMTMVTDTTGYLGALTAVNTGTPTCVFIWQLPHSLKLGTDIKPHVHYVQDASTGEISFQASFKHVPLSGTATAWTTMALGTKDLTPSAAHQGGLTSWTLDDDTYHFGISDIVMMTLQRTTAGNTSTGSAYVLSGDIHCQRVRLGSISEASLP